MTRESQLSKRPKAPSPGPIKPGSPLHRLLQMIAEEIAKGRGQRTADRPQTTTKMPIIWAACLYRSHRIMRSECVLSSRLFSR